MQQRALIRNIFTDGAPGNLLAFILVVLVYFSFEYVFVLFYDG